MSGPAPSSGTTGATAGSRLELAVGVGAFLGEPVGLGRGRADGVEPPLDVRDGLRDARDVARHLPGTRRLLRDGAGEPIECRLRTTLFVLVRPGVGPFGVGVGTHPATRQAPAVVPATRAPVRRSWTVRVFVLCSYPRWRLSHDGERVTADQAEAPDVGLCW